MPEIQENVTYRPLVDFIVVQTPKRKPIHGSGAPLVEAEEINDRNKLRFFDRRNPQKTILLLIPVHYGINKLKYDEIRVIQTPQGEHHRKVAEHKDLIEVIRRIYRNCAAAGIGLEIDFEIL